MSNEVARYSSAAKPGHRKLLIMLTNIREAKAHLGKAGKMAGVEGFERSHGDTKNRCLTAWLHPNTVRTVYSDQFCQVQEPPPHCSTNQCMVFPSLCHPAAARAPDRLPFRLKALRPVQPVPRIPAIIRPARDALSARMPSGVAAGVCRCAGRNRRSCANNHPQKAPMNGELCDGKRQAPLRGEISGANRPPHQRCASLRCSRQALRLA